MKLNGLLGIFLIGTCAYAQSSPYLFVVNKAADTVSVVNARTRAVESTVRVGGTPHELGVSPDGTKAYVSNTATNNVSAIDLKTRAERTISHPEFSFPHGVAFTADSRYALVTSERSKKIFLIETSSDRVSRVISTDQAGTHMAVVNKAGTQAYFSNRESNSVSIMDLKDFTFLAHVPVGAGAEGLDVSPDGKEVWVGNRSANSLSVIDVARRQVVATLPAGNAPIRVSFTPDNKHVLVPGGGEVRVYDVPSRKQIATIAVAGNPGGVIVSSDGKQAYVACQSSNDVKVIDTATWKVVSSIPVGRGPDGLALR